MSDIVELTNPPRTVRLAGVDYRAAELTPRDLGELQAWLNEQVPAALTQVARLMEGKPEAVQVHMWDAALGSLGHAWPLRLEDAAGRKLLLFDPEGQARFLHVTLRRHTAGFTLDQARKLAERLDADDFGRLQAAIGGDAGPVGPKGEAP